MNVFLQIKTLFVSFLFGFFFSFFIGFFYRFLYNKRIWLQIITSLFLTLSAIICYFLLLKRINNAVFHVYEIFCLIIGYALETLISGKIAKKNKR